ncbi:MAG: chromosome segregation protein SMC [Defluviitaleaceae bacterium]|nr:chromosome segregation protein SMC [Defluviitaleaceae bacterium]
MYLKRLELQGFKSFPAKIALDFRAGITAVVGPNGSGKSNISDALRWVLGEQSAKSLRGGKMEDIIFSGTLERKPVGFAEVSITIDNSDRRLAPEYSELKVTRRIFRVGEGEFALNGVTCRLKDIHAAFMDTGLGREGYSIVGQGRIDEIIGSRVETRRYLFEEAAGIVKFKTRKGEAEDKLAKEAANLLRLNDILGELEARLPHMLAQADKAREYLKMRERQKHLLANLFLLDITDAEDKLAKLAAAIGTAQGQAEEEEFRLADLEERHSGAKREEARLAAGIKSAEADLADNRLAKEANDNQIRLNDEKLRGLDARISLAEERRAKEAARALELERELDGTRNRHAELDRAIAAGEEELGRLEALAIGQSADISREEQAAQDIHSLVIESLKLSGQLEGKAANIDGIAAGLAERKARLDDEAEACRISAQQCREALEAAHAELAPAGQRLADEEREIALLEERRGVREAQAASRAAELEQIQRDIHTKETRRRVLSELRDSFEGYTRAVKVIMRERGRFAGILGTVGEFCRPQPSCETAVEVSLGAAMQNIITEDEEAAQAAIEYLKATGAGRTTFLPLSAIKEQPPISRKDMLEEAGVRGTAYGLISCDERFGAVFRNLLGRTLVLDTMEHAVRFSRKYAQSVRVVTLTGELLSVGGAITGGSRNEKSSGVFGRSREIAELEEALRGLGEKARLLEEDARAARERLRGLVRELDELHARHEDTQRTCHTVSEQVSKLEAERAAAAERLERLMAEDGDLIRQQSEVAEHIAALEAQKREADEAAQAAQAKAAQLQTSLQTYREHRDTQSQNITELKVELGAREQERLDVAAQAERLEREAQANRNELNKLAQEIAASESGLERNRAATAELAEAGGKLAEAGRGLAARLAELEREMAAMRESTGQAEAEAKACGETITALQHDLVRLVTQQEHALGERRKLFDTMWEDYQLTPSSAGEYPALADSADKLRLEERGIRAKMGMMGGVNVDAIEEYRAASNRVEQMTIQRDDIITAREDLQALIQELEGLMEQQFREQFALLSESFGVVFGQMFGGGKAYLRLLDEDNALESGIDIIAQPPGKALTSMSLLSGGERALTALALLFGILRLKPSPFVILDEVESALDDANVARFATFLKDVASRETQFIVITHRRGTMEAADTLYGITMQERGVSKVVSVQI